MARHLLWFIGAVLVLAAGMTACESGARPDEDTGQSFTVVNSALSTFRIVSAQAGPVGSYIGNLYIHGDGLHKGGSQSYGVSDDECDKEWKVIVYYNDPGSTYCAQVRTVPCGGSATFVFNNTLCSR